MKICLILLGCLIVFAAPSITSAASFQAVTPEKSQILVDGLSGMFSGARFQNKGWNDGYTHRSYYYGNNQPLGSHNRLGVWLTELAPGRIYTRPQEVRELPNRFGLFKNRGNLIHDTGKVKTSFGNADYVTFRSEQTPCAIFSSTFGNKSLHMGTEAGTARLNGYVCLKAGDALTATLLQRILLSVGIRDVSEPEPFASEAAAPAAAATSTGKKDRGKSAAGDASPIARLGALKQLLDKGLITPADYDRKKKEILDGL